MIKLKNIKKVKLFGFTIVELMVSISIFTILSSIAYMGYYSYTSNSRDVSRVTNLTNIKKALELEKTNSKTLPIPENSTEVKYLGKTVWYNGSIGTGTLSGLNYFVDDLDPKYKDVNFNYSLDTKENIYELGTILENEGNELPISFLIDKTYAFGDEKAYNFGTFNKLFVKTKVNGELHVISVPSMVLNTNQDYDLVVNQETNLFSINNTYLLPGNYSQYSDTGTGTLFTPRLLYKGNKCGVETDEEVVNFISGLNESYSDDIFKNNPDYKFIYDNYDLLRSDITNFSNIEKVGSVINSLLDCNITKFIKTEVFPIKCGIEDGTFEFFKNDFDIKESCLYSYEGTGTAIVKTGVGKLGSKGVDINVPSGTGKFKYRVFSYAPTKLNFDLKTFLDGSSTVRFYINNLEYLYLSGNGTNYNSGFQTFSTPLLPPGIYDFRWEITRSAGSSSYAYLDNINFTCIGGGAGCGWTGFTPDNSVEKGDIFPWDIFTFGGNANIPWNQVSGTGNFTNGSYAIKNPVLPFDGATSNLILKKTFTEPQKLSFDIKTYLSSYSNTTFYINGVLTYFWQGLWENHNSGFYTYTTPLLPAGDYTFEWKTKRSYGGNNQTIIDNFKYSCIGGGNGCGRTEGFEDGNINPNDMFTFSGNIPWNRVTGTGNISEGIYALKSNSVDPRQTTTMNYNKTLTNSAKLNFDYRIFGSRNSAVRFFINGTEYKNWNYEAQDNSHSFQYHTYTTPLLPPGNYVFSWSVMQGNYPDYDRAYIYLDNLRYTCVGGGVGCGYDIKMEDSSSNPWDIFTFTGTTQTPWYRISDTYTWSEFASIDYVNTTGNTTEGNYTLVSPGGGTQRTTKSMILNKHFDVPQKIKFDYRIKNSAGGKVNFYINGKNYISKSSGYTYHLGSYENFESILLPAGDYTFKWDVTQGNYTAYGYTQLILDNIDFTCVGGGGTCGRDLGGFENGSYNPWDLFTFDSTNIPWNRGTDSSSGSYALVSPQNSGILEYHKTLTQPGKLNFDLKTNFTSASQVWFYINGVMYMNLYGNLNYQTFTTPLLPAGDYKFKWQLYRWGGYSNFWLDNINITCNGGAGISGNELCGLSDFSPDNSFESGNKNPWDLFTFAGSTNLPWLHVSGVGDASSGNYALKSPVGQSNGEVIYNKVLTQTGTFNFDLKTNFTSASQVWFYINGIKTMTLNGNLNYQTFSTAELPPGNYQFKWMTYRWGGSPEVWLDNFKFNP